MFEKQAVELLYIMCYRDTYSKIMKADGTVDFKRDAIYYFYYPLWVIDTNQIHKGTIQLTVY